jgi:hypothetical protein
LKIEKNKLVKVLWKSEEFGDCLCVDDINGLILDTIQVFGKINNACKEISFYIRNTNGKTFIHPQMYAQEYYILADRVINADVIEIKAEDYVQHYATMGGSFEFVLKDKIDNNSDDFLKVF